MVGDNSTADRVQEFLENIQSKGLATKSSLGGVICYALRRSRVSEYISHIKLTQAYEILYAEYKGYSNTLYMSGENVSDTDLELFVNTVTRSEPIFKQRLLSKCYIFPDGLKLDKKL